jgi:hypothetical protein
MPGVDMTAQGLRDLLGPDPTCSGQSASSRLRRTRGCRPAAAAAAAWEPRFARLARRVPGPAHGAAAGAKCVIASVPCRF